ncbi:signal peptide peptidase-like 2C [Sorex fumeus]|uniref:signal peptide peptidase-like 2C n=1 Tax=Sorex fumeus TaxID=62283 RepID=UPI0024AE44BF|nr:signal peptide peptidase-like 2C [Sorex fumeus]
MACQGPLLLLLLLLLARTTVQGEYGVAHVVAGTWSKDYCVLFSSDQVTLPRELRHAPLLPLHDGTTTSWCPGETSSSSSSSSQVLARAPRPLHHTTAMVLRGNCSFHAKGWLAQDHGAHGLLIVSRANGQQCSDTPGAPQEPMKALPDLAIPVAVLRYADMLDIFSHTCGHPAPVRVALYAPPEPILDYNMVVIFVLAVGTVAVGGYWAGVTEADRLQRHRAQGGGGGGPGGDPHTEATAVTTTGAQARLLEEYDEDTPVDFSPAMTGAVVAMSCSIMLLLYFFYDHFVYVMITIFGLGAATGLYGCLAPLVRRLPLQQCQWALPGHRACLPLPLLLLAGLCAMVTALWVTYRNEDRWAWLLQDTLGVAYCLLVMRRVRLPTLRNCTSFLLALLAFDVFFVFVTPLLTRTGASIMVEVASGPTNSLSQERLPMVLKVPRLRFSALTLCDQPFSILGFGDIVVPGFLVAYCHRFDVQIHSRQVYFVACTVAYAVGLLVTFLAMLHMQMGQPALLYLVSSTLLTSLAVAICRQEFTLFWTGQVRTKCPARLPVSQCWVPAAGSGRRGPASELEDSAEHRPMAAGDNLEEEDTAEIITISEDEASGLGSPTESSEGWSDTDLDAAGASDERLPLMPVAMLIPLMPLMPPPSELGHTHPQTQDASMPWMGFHKRRGLHVKRSRSTQAPL